MATAKKKSTIPAEKFESYGVVKNGWATVPEKLLEKTNELKKYLEISFEYTKTLKPK